MAEHHKRHVLLALLGAGGLLLLGGLVAVSVLLSGVMSTAATKQHLRVTHRILDLGLSYSVRAKSGDLVAPALDDPQLIEHGLACYRRYCAECHGAPGVAPGAAALGMMPVPTNLAGVAGQQPSEWLYYVTRKGVRMTGMPAWEFRLSDESLWSVVAFLETLPTLTAAEYGARAQASGPSDCEGRAQQAPPPDPDGAVLLRQYACHSCHVIQGVVGPEIRVGPALEEWPRRAVIAGRLANTPENLAAYIRDPRAQDPGSLMPTLGVTEADARAMARFLFAQQ
jgi:mono/diheme cytochrome c family protein